MPEDKPPPTLAKESVASMEQRKSRATAKTHIIFNHVLPGIQTSDLMMRQSYHNAPLSRKELCAAFPRASTLAVGTKGLQLTHRTWYTRDRPRVPGAILDFRLRSKIKNP
jgi:hypothetical protein